MITDVGIKNFLLKEAKHRVTDAEAKELLLKEATTRVEEFEVRPLIKEGETKKEMLSDAVLRLAFLDEKNQDVPFRIDFKKETLPVENQKKIQAELGELAEDLPRLAQQLDRAGLSPVPYFNIQCEKSHRSPAVVLGQSIQSKLMNPVPTEGGESNFLQQNPRLKDYWQKMMMELTKDPSSFPAFFHNVGGSTYGTASRVSADQMKELKNLNSLLWAVHYAEVRQGRSLFCGSPAEAKNKKKEWEEFVFDKVLTEVEDNEKAKETADKIWGVFGAIPPSKRDMETMKLNKPGKILPPYDRFNEHELRLLLDFLGVSDLRFRASPRQRPNGLDMLHIYPPVDFVSEDEDGRYELDYNRGNLGISYLKKHLGKILDSVLSKNADTINRIYQELLTKHPNHPVMSSHTGGDNLLFLLQDLSQMEISEKLPAEYQEGVKLQHSRRARAVLAFVSKLLERFKTVKPANDILNHGPQLYKMLTERGEDGICFGYKVAKIMDLIYYTIIKHLPDGPSRVRKQEETLSFEPDYRLRGSVIDRLMKVADRFDKQGHTRLANKVDLLIAKLGEKE